MEWALLCDGVPRDEIYAVLETEAGQARPLAKLDTIKEDVVWWSAGAETPRLLTDGQPEDQFALFITGGGPSTEMLWTIDFKPGSVAGFRQPCLPTNAHQSCGECRQHQP